MDWNVHGDKWQSTHWREKIATASAKLQRFIPLSLLVRFFFGRCRRDSAGLKLRFREFAPAGDKNVLCLQAPEFRSRQVSIPVSYSVTHLNLPAWVSHHISLLGPPALIRCDDLPATITHVSLAAVLVLNTPDDGRLRQKHVE